LKRRGGCEGKNLQPGILAQLFVQFFGQVRVVSRVPDSSYTVLCFPVPALDSFYTFSAVVRARISGDVRAGALPDSEDTPPNTNKNPYSAKPFFSAGKRSGPKKADPGNTAANTGEISFATEKTGDHGKGRTEE